MNPDLKQKIYKARCIGNVEPIEYMVPYPSMRSLIEGQNIKYAEQVIFNDPELTNLQFYELIQQTAHWLDSIGLKPKERIILSELDFPQTEILLFGIWHLGAVAVIPSHIEIDEVIQSFGASLVVPSNTDLFESIKDFPKVFDPKYKPLLDDEALISFEKSAGVRLSHYNLLVNTNSIQKAIGLKSRTPFNCHLTPTSTAWAVLKAILPIYCGCITSEKNPEFTIGESDCTFNIRTDLENHNQFDETDIGICPENGAVLSVGQIPLHLTECHFHDNEIELHGHSLMMGYLDNELNEFCFREGGFFLPID